MICIIAGNHREASQWAYGQLLDKSEWFYPQDFEDLKSRENFHVVVVGSAGQNVTPAYFERLLHLAKSRGKINRK
jgi:fructose-1-phosphate kinase PfkB-like protein